MVNINCFLILCLEMIRRGTAVNVGNAITNGLGIWRLNNLEHCRELSRKYREQKRYQSSHLEKFREYNKRYRDNMSPEQKLKQRIRDKRYVESARNNPVYLEKRRQWSRESARRTCKHHTRYEQLRKQYDAEFKLKKQIRILFVRPLRGEFRINLVIRRK